LDKFAVTCWVLSKSQVISAAPSTVKRETGPKHEVSREIENLLLIHEKKSGANIPTGPALDAQNDSDSSDSEAEMTKVNDTHKTEGIF